MITSAYTSSLSTTDADNDLLSHGLPALNLSAIESREVIQGRTTIDIVPEPMPEVLKERLTASAYLEMLTDKESKNSCWYLDGYRNLKIRIAGESLSSVEDAELIKSEILQIKEILSNSWFMHGLYVYFPENKAHLIDSLLRNDFEREEWIHERKELGYIFRNGRGIPLLNSAFLTASVIVIRRDPETNQRDVLFVNEPEKQHLTFPAGHVDRGELVISGALREINEETGLELNAEDLQLFQVRNETGLGVNGDKNHVDFTYYVEIPYETPIKVDGREVIGFAWVPLSTVSDFALNEKRISPLYIKMLTIFNPKGVAYCTSPERSHRKSLYSIMPRTPSWPCELHRT